MKTFVIGDIHGAHLALEQCLLRSGFDRDNDLLITLGDICDGWPFVYECVEILLTIKNRIDIMGNHDEWFYKWLLTGEHPDYWCQGGYNTAMSYMRFLNRWDSLTGSKTTGYALAIHPDEIPQSHHDFFHNQQYYHLDAKNRLFVHAGINRNQTLQQSEQYEPSVFLWDRLLIQEAIEAQSEGRPLTFREPFSEIFLGHTQTSHLRSKAVRGLIRSESANHDVIHAGIVWNLDTGAGWNGHLTIMEIDNLIISKSDNVADLYPEFKGRK